MEGLKTECVCIFDNMWILLNSTKISFCLVISCSVGADNVGVKRYFMSCFTACVRPKLDPISFDITSHKLISIHAPPTHPFRTHLTFAQSFDRISQPIVIVDRTSHPIISVDNTPFPLVSETSHNGF